MIEIRDLLVRYGPVMALDVPQLDIAAGECLLVTGPSGCGKSTLARALNGLIPHAIHAELAGSVRVCGMDTQSHSVAELARHVGAVFQNPATQLFHLRVEDDVAFGPRNLGLSDQDVQDQVNWALAALGAEALRERSSSELSGGQKQLVAIAAALAMRPEVLVLDEPTASLDVAGTNNVLSALLKLRELGITLVIIEHRLADVTRLAERMIVMDQGRIVLDGDLTQVLSERDIWQQLGLRRPVDKPLGAWDTLLKPNGTPPAGVQPLIELQGVSAGYDGVMAIQDANLALYPGEFVALVGDNGAGKSTLALVATGLLKPAAGCLSYGAGQKLRPGLDVSLLFQDPAEQLFTDSVEEEVAFAPRNFRRFEQERHEQTLAEADLMALRGRPPLALSMGQQQRTALAACLSTRPRLLILDEPTLGQDWGHLQRLMDFLTILNESGITILLITHDYKLVHRYAQRVILLDQGRIMMDGRLRYAGANS